MSPQVLFKGLKASASQILTIVMAFVVICVGITILQMSKVDPTEFKTLDRRSTILFQASRKHTEGVEEKYISTVEEPGIDTLRGSFGTIGSIIRARSARRMSQSSGISGNSSRLAAVGHGAPASSSSFAASNFNHYGGVQRHQLFDPPVPRGDVPENDAISLSSHPSTRKATTIKFGEQDVVHSYHRGTTGKDDLATHEHRIPRASSPLASSPVAFAQPRFSPSGNVSGSPSNLQQSPVTKLEPPPRFDLGVNEPRSAPPAVGLVETAYRDPFERGPATATLPSFHSTPALDDDLGPRRHRRQGSSRAYPKTDNGNDDAEERVSLWNPERDSTGEDIDISVSPESSHGTVRLVGSSRPGRF